MQFSVYTRKDVSGKIQALGEDWNRHHPRCWDLLFRILIFYRPVPRKNSILVLWQGFVAIAARHPEQLECPLCQLAGEMVSDIESKRVLSTCWKRCRTVICTSRRI